MPERWQYSATNLGRVTLGVESGDPDVLNAYGKGRQPDDLIRIIADLKASEIGVGLVVLIGAGGREMAARHLDASVTGQGSAGEFSLARR